MNRIYAIHEDGKFIESNSPKRVYTREGFAKNGVHHIKRRNKEANVEIVPYVPESEAVRLRAALERIAGYTMSMCPSVDEMPRLLKRIAIEALGEASDTGESE